MDRASPAQADEWKLRLTSFYDSSGCRIYRKKIMECCGKMFEKENVLSLPK
jgi:hypothetical protein